MTQFRAFEAVAALSLFAWPFLAAAVAQPVPHAENHVPEAVLPMKVADGIHFREIGPAIGGGRVTSVVGEVGRPDHYYVGTADGGIFRTEDGGTTWKALFQHQRVASIGALAIDPRNPSVIWAGTGEANVRNDVSFGNGIYRSTDAGIHWVHMGLDHTFQVSAIAVDPLDSRIVIVAAMGSPWGNSPDRGVYRTIDGGKSWQRVLYVGPSVGISDLAMDPQNPQIVFAATYRFRRTPWAYSDGGPEDAIYKSIDGGTTWRRLSGHGLPTEPLARIGLAIAPSSPNIVYAVIASRKGVLWRSDDYGDQWSLVSKNNLVNARPFYFSHVVVDPKNPDRIFALSMNLFESLDGGRTFQIIAKKIHVDYHAMWIDPDGSGHMIDGNDGGPAISRDNGRTWSAVSNLPIGQYYHVSVGGGMRYEVCGGLQDNSSWCGLSWSKDPSGILGRKWFALNDGDGIYGIQAPDDPNLFYSTSQNASLTILNRATGEKRDIEPYPRNFLGENVIKLPYRFAWEAGFAISQENPKVLYLGGNVLFKTEDRGRTWHVISPDLTRNDKSKQGYSGGPVFKDNSGSEVYDAILSIAVAKSDPNTIWVGTDDGEVQLTRNGGQSWSNLTAHIHRLPPWGRIESIDVSSTDPGDVLIAVDRHFSGDFQPYLFHSSDYGAHWSSVSGNLPRKVYAHVIRRDLHNPNLYYGGLENGLYLSFDAGGHWYPFGLGLPDAAVYDIALDARDNDLIAATHGRSLWVLDDLTPFQQFDLKAARRPLALFKPEDALRYHPLSEVGDLGDGVFYGQNPTYGAAITYYLSKPASTPVRLVITDASGQVVRTLKGPHASKATDTNPQEPSAAEGAAGSRALSNSPQAAAEDHRPRETVTPPLGQPGLHRIYWDLRAEGDPRGAKEGALVPPGKYGATLTIGEHTVSQTFAVVNDPDSGAPLARMQQRYELAKAVLHEISELHNALNRLSAIDKQTKALRGAVEGAPEQALVDSAIDSLERSATSVKLEITNNSGVGEPILSVPSKVLQHLQALDRLIEGADNPLTPATLQVKAIYDAEYRAALTAYDQFLATDVANFNGNMITHHLSGVVPGRSLAP